MTASPMHENQVPTDVGLVRRLLAGRFPRWADREITPVASSGTVNALYRLGTDLVVRLPVVDHDPGEIVQDQRWLPRLAPHLTVSVPEVVAVGEPALGYPWTWAVYRWIDGRDATAVPLDPVAEVGLAHDLAGFVRALQAVDTAGGPRPVAPGTARRGAPLAGFDVAVRRGLGQIDAVGGLLDVPAAVDVWREAVAAPAWSSAPVWFHGDLMPGNLLLVDGRLRAVIDWGCLGVGDPACELMPAWNLFTAPGREAYRAALGVDDATWRRGRGWALLQAVLALPYYLDTNPGMVAVARRALSELVAPTGL